MPGLYARWIDRWERHLAGRDTNRAAHPLEWGLDWLGLPAAAEPRAALRDWAARAAGDSDAFYSYAVPPDYHLKDGCLSFTSPVESPYPENNLVRADLYPCRRDRGRAVLVLPQWNADLASHAGLCRLLNRFGLTALRLSLAYHGPRRPPGQARADYHVSANIGRTIHAGRQSVADARACLDWLQRQGYTRLAVLGTSLGSCIAFIVAAHDARVRAAVYNHVSMYFGDVVWTGLSTRYVREGLAGRITQDELRQWWSPISPATYLPRMRERRIPSLLVWARYDTSFLPVYSRQILDWFRESGLPHRAIALPCAHYTTGEFPFKLVDGFAMCRFLASAA